MSFCEIRVESRLNEGSDYVRISDVSGSSFVTKGENDMWQKILGENQGDVINYEIRNSRKFTIPMQVSKPP